MKSLGLFILLSSAFVTSQGISSHGSNKDTCKVPVLKNGSYESEKVLFQVGEWLQYHCDKGYMTAQRNIVEKVQCLSTGWSAVPQCSGIACSFQPKTGSDKLHLVYTHSLVAKFSCNDGFILNGSEISQCYYYGWDPPLPTCQDFDSCQLSMDKIVQSNLVVPKSTSIGKVYNNGDHILSRCKANYYRASPTLKVECLNGEMIYPKCTQEKPCRINQEKIDENFLELHPNYDSKVFYEDGEIIRFVCKAGYTILTDTDGQCIKEDIFYPVCHEI
ncbi:coagulation factor XIII B chain-like isoform X2 [Dendrobates tinctorius]|uniref:coagulation factor XIII B chain-like isoform X2 n=1 Tax=Dendrobates tinctorius TaxID=92724 RepID=UPI003CCA3EED